MTAEMGVFELMDGTKVAGSLKLAGARTSLSLYSNDFFNAVYVGDGYISGCLNDLTKVSLIDCVPVRAGTLSREAGQSHFAHVFPHFVVSGSRHLRPDENAISTIDFTMDDAPTLFYDFDAFGSVIDARPLIKQVVLANKLDREIQIGDYPRIQYYTGKGEIFRSETWIGIISAHHSPSWSFPGPRGVGMRNTIRVAIEFRTAVQFSFAIEQIYILQSYLGLLVGRPQTLSGIGIQLNDEIEGPTILDVHWSYVPRRKGSKDQGNPHPGDVLIDAVRRPAKFSKVLANWIGRQPTWSDARQRFFGVFANRREYGVDKLIGAANMFDILPADAVPVVIPISSELEEAKAAARRQFRALDPSPERASVLVALGNIGKPNLKRKVQFRAELLLQRLPDRLPGLITVVDEAVNCRNFFVHGGESKIQYRENSPLVWFLTDTLEFVFGISDLIDCGWDIQEWNSRTSVDHPFGSYLRNYIGFLERFKVVTGRSDLVPSPID
jgi:hypothetical protein